MNQPSTHSNNRRRNRRGGGGGGQQRRSSSSSRYETFSRPPKAPPTLWERILGFFKGKPSAPTKPAPASHPASKPAAAPSQRPAAASAPARPPQQQQAQRFESARKPECVEVTTGRLYVGNLSYDATEEDLTNLFNGVGQVASTEVITHRRTQRSKGYAFVQMNSTEEARRAVEQLHDQDFMGRKLVVSGAKQAEEHTKNDSSSEDSED